MGDLEVQVSKKGCGPKGEPVKPSGHGVEPCSTKVNIASSGPAASQKREFWNSQKPLVFQFERHPARLMRL